jgi:pyruvate, water dikinase
VSEGGEHTRALSELAAGDAERFGGKSASLGELIAAGVPVPPGFAVASTAFRGFVDEAGLEPQIAGRLAKLDPADLDALRSASRELGDAVRGAPVAESLREELAARYEALAGEGDEAAPPVAVRSSALGEDSADATFAGQQETYLWVRGADAVCDAVQRCWASLYTPEAIAYRARIEAGPAAMGVTVQRMVDAGVSGVLFTCNPVSGDPSTVAVNASWGLGLAVVGGEVTPDEYRVSKVTGEVLHRTIGPKAVEYVAGSDGAERRDVPPERRERPCLDDDQLAALVAVGRRVERHFDSPQDVEWAIDRGGTLYLLQSRPVTALRKRKGMAGGSALDLVMDTFGARPERD